MMFFARWLLMAALIGGGAAVYTKAHAGNQGQNTVDVKTVGVTLAVTNTWQQVAKTDVQRATLVCMNVGSNNMGFYISRNGNGNIAPTPVGIGSLGVFTLYPAGSYEPDGGWIPGGEIWAIGTSGDVISCNVSPTQP